MYHSVPHGTSLCPHIFLTCWGSLQWVIGVVRRLWLLWHHPYWYWILIGAPPNCLVNCPVSRRSCNFGSVGLALPCILTICRWYRFGGTQTQSPGSGSGGWELSLSAPCEPVFFKELEDKKSPCLLHLGFTLTFKIDFWIEPGFIPHLHSVTVWFGFGSTWNLCGFFWVCASLKSFPREGRQCTF